MRCTWMFLICLKATLAWHILFLISEVHFPPDVTRVSRYWNVSRLLLVLWNAFRCGLFFFRNITVVFVLLLVKVWALHLAFCYYSKEKITRKKAEDKRCRRKRTGYYDTNFTCCYFDAVLVGKFARETVQENDAAHVLQHVCLKIVL